MITFMTTFMIILLCWLSYKYLFFFFSFKTNFGYSKKEQITYKYFIIIGANPKTHVFDCFTQIQATSLMF